MSGKIEKSTFANEGPASYALPSPISAGSLSRTLSSSSVVPFTREPEAATNDGADRAFFLRLLAGLIALTLFSGAIAFSAVARDLAFFDS